MRDTEAKDDAHSTAPTARQRLWPRFLGSLILLGLLSGLMLGRLTAPGEVRLLTIEPQTAGLTLWFDRAPEIFAESRDGTYALRIAARGQSEQGQLRLGQALINWRLRPVDRYLLLGFVAARPLSAAWRAVADGERWRVDIRLAMP
ncbi:hypothetical protein [Azomonas macrocytogenes]|uniref:Putative lipid-binding transport protein (Tim44 family) n=1 Tax=Azomonas macrocytogenes TaxID=69962 RepID=A0A839T9K0_AZOMA|nr:hypothetical protein [Azomonas macrocytogenes]MBB3104313.1 putative lipid-binding transport protein (Tim44 family) [Azomonas macrocytogenes]